MIRLLCLAILIIACGRTAGAPAGPIPFAMAPGDAVLHFSAPLDTATAPIEPRNIYSRAPVPAGVVEFAWQPAAAADRYVLALVDVSAFQPGSDEPLSTYAVMTTAEPRVSVQLDETGDAGLPLALQFQVFAYADDELVAWSDVWGVEVRPSARVVR